VQDKDVNKQVYLDRTNASDVTGTTCKSCTLNCIITYINLYYVHGHTEFYCILEQEHN